jgi:hypothetical protein
VFPHKQPYHPTRPQSSKAGYTWQDAHYPPLAHEEEYDVPAARSTSLDLTSTDPDYEIGDEGILRFTGTMGDHDAPAGCVGVCGGLEGFGDGSDLVDFEEEGITRFLVNGFLDADGVGDGEIVADDLVVVFAGKVGPGLPIILIKWIFNTSN